MKARIFLATALLLIAAVVYQSALAAPRGGAPRALPPAWPREVVETFFPDAREKLVGERPAFRAGNLANTGGAGAVPGQEEAESDAGDGFAWSKLIAAATLEDEIKAQKMAVDQTVDTPGGFKGGAYRDARIQFSTLAAMFHIAGQFDKDVRWKDEAPGLRDLFGRAGFNCKVGTDQSYNEAKLRKQDLGDLIRGDTVQSAEKGERDVTWDKVTNRPPLMSRMELAFQKRISPFLANESEFSAHAEEIYHEAQVLAALAEAIQHEGFEFWDDDDYLAFAKQMRDAAVGIVEGVKQNDYEKARKAAGDVSKACTECHESYRA